MPGACSRGSGCPAINVGSQRRNLIYLTHSLHYSLLGEPIRPQVMRVTDEIGEGGFGKSIGAHVSQLLNDRVQEDGPAKVIVLELNVGDVYVKMIV